MKISYAITAMYFPYILLFLVLIFFVGKLIKDGKFKALFFQLKLPTKQLSLEERVRNFSKGAINNIAINIILTILIVIISVILILNATKKRDLDNAYAFVSVLSFFASVFNIYIWVRLYRNLSPNYLDSSIKKEEKNISINYRNKNDRNFDLKSLIKSISQILNKISLKIYFIILLISFFTFLMFGVGAVAFFICLYQIWKRRQKLVNTINNYKPIIKSKSKQIIIFIKKYAKNSKERIAKYYHKLKNKKKVKWTLILLFALLISIYPLNKLYQYLTENRLNKELVDEEITEESFDEEITDEELVDEEMTDEEMADEEMADEESFDEEITDEELVNEINSEQEKSEFQMNSLDNKDITKNYISAKIIIGSFGAKENAEKLKKSLLIEGFENIDISKVGNINRVSILVSGSKEDAQEILKKVKVNHKSAWISYN